MYILIVKKKLSQTDTLVLTLACLILPTVVSQIIALSAAFAFGSTGHEKLKQTNKVIWISSIHLSRLF